MILSPLVVCSRFVRGLRTFCSLPVRRTSSILRIAEISSFGHDTKRTSRTKIEAAGSFHGLLTFGPGSRLTTSGFRILLVVGSTPEDVEED
jgi:hypothetical protein